MKYSAYILTVISFVILGCGGTHPINSASSDRADSDSADANTEAMCVVSGDLQRWHRVELVCKGPFGSEEHEETFTDYRFNVMFSQGGMSYTIPGHFAADNDAANSGARSGNLWRAYFSPSATGSWDYRVSFRQGENIAVSEDIQLGIPVERLDGVTGRFDIAPSKAVAPDMRSGGLLRKLDGERYLRFSGNDQVFIQGGVNSPENIFGYFEFDNTTKFDTAESCKGILHEFLSHGADWRNGDPSWGDGRGKHVVGLVNYVASRGVNSLYVMLNTVNGDGCDAHPWSVYNSTGNVKTFDVSKLDQWEIVFSHMTSNGLMIHAMTQETENDHLLNIGDLGLERKLYYRELISRFGHHPALQWNLGEENTNTTDQRKAYTDYLRVLDPYDHPIMMHTFPRKHDEYEGMLGYPKFDGATFQVGPISADPSAEGAGTYGLARRWLEKSAQAGNQWVTTFVEASGRQAPAQNEPMTDRQRVFWMWASVMSGGGGFEWYLRNKGKGHALDLSVEDMRDFDEHWTQSGYLVRFFRDIIQTAHGIEMTDLAPDNSVTTTDTDWVLSKPGDTYLIFLREGGATHINLPSGSNYRAHWFNPRTGQLTLGDLMAGSADARIANPPSEPGLDWALLLKAEQTSN